MTALSSTSAPPDCGARTARTSPKRRRSWQIAANTTRLRCAAFDRPIGFPWHKDSALNPSFGCRAIRRAKSRPSGTGPKANRTGVPRDSSAAMLSSILSTSPAVDCGIASKWTGTTGGNPCKYLASLKVFGNSRVTSIPSSQAARAPIRARATANGFRRRRVITDRQPFFYVDGPGDRAYPATLWRRQCPGNAAGLLLTQV